MSAQEYFPDDGELDFDPVVWPQTSAVALSELYLQARVRHAVAVGRALEAREAKNFTVLGYRLDAAHEAAKIERLYRPHA